MGLKVVYVEEHNFEGFQMDLHKGYVSITTFCTCGWLLYFDTPKKSEKKQAYKEDAIAVHTRHARSQNV